MTKLYYISFFSLFFFLNQSLLCSQNIQISDPVDINDDIDYQLIARYEEELLLYRQEKSKHAIQCFNQELKENWEKALSFEKKQVSVFKVIAHKDHFHLLYSYHHKGNTHVRAKLFNTLAEEQDDFEIGVFKSPRYVKPYHLIEAQNKQHFLLYSITLGNELEVINYDLANKTQYWHKEINFEGLNYYREFEQLLINNLGETFIVYNQNNNKRKCDSHQFKICKISTDFETTFKEIRFNNYTSYDLRAKYDEVNQQLVVAGLYSTNHLEASGIFYFNTNLIEHSTVQTSPLEESFMRSLTGRKKRNITGVQNFIIDQLILRKDGGALLIAEQRFAYEVKGAFLPEEKSSTQADYLYENILVASIHPNGRVYWKDVLYKSQSSENDDARYSSFFAFTTNANIRFLYNNNISWDTSIFEYVVSGKGDVKRNVLTHQELNNGILPQLTNSIQVSASEVIAISQRDQKMRLMKINY